LNLRQRLSEYVRACFTGIWLESHEHQDAIAEMAQLCHDENWQMATWDVESGLSISGQSESGSNDPLAAIRSINALASAGGTAVLVLQNFHRFLQSAEVVQALIRQIMSGKQNRTIVVILAPLVMIPVELEKLFVVIEHELPNREQLEAIARGIATEAGELPEGPELENVMNAASGLTRMEAENAFSLSLVRHERIRADTVWELKTQMLKKDALVSLYRGTDDFTRLGGLSSLKAFCKQALATNGSDPRKRARGVLLLSPPGCGKSQFCKALGKEVGRPVLILDVGSLMGSLVGQSEERTRQALRIIDAMEPCIVMIDEVEKAFAGLGSGGDSGVASRMFGTFLSWLNDHESDVFVVCTANDVSKLPPEFGRSERFDGIFFLDLPSRQEKDAIWLLYQSHFEIDQNQPKPDDTNWTGAEIKSCCRLAAMLDLPLVQAAQNVVPVAVTAAESIDQLRGWASGRCLCASHSGVYNYADPSSKARRRVSREPSIN
jgi:SpoVK/Ycf46/Vps4 family AAA+-type ATPase